MKSAKLFTRKDYHLIPLFHLFYILGKYMANTHNCNATLCFIQQHIIYSYHHRATKLRSLIRIFYSRGGQVKHKEPTNLILIDSRYTHRRSGIYHLHQGYAQLLSQIRL